MVALRPLLPHGTLQRQSARNPCMVRPWSACADGAARLAAVAEQPQPAFHLVVRSAGLSLGFGGTAKGRPLSRAKLKFWNKLHLRQAAMVSNIRSISHRTCAVRACATGARHCLFPRDQPPP